MVQVLVALLVTHFQWVFNVYLTLQTDADRKLLAAKGSVAIGIGQNSHIKRAIIDKNARIGDNVKVSSSIKTLVRPCTLPCTYLIDLLYNFTI